jgi:hypothetical protein
VAAVSWREQLVRDYTQRQARQAALRHAPVLFAIHWRQQRCSQQRGNAQMRIAVAPACASGSRADRQLRVLEEHAAQGVREEEEAAEFNLPVPSRSVPPG